MTDHKARELLITNDGSHTIAVPALGITYHSTHGAVQESMHIFIDACLKYAWSRQPDSSRVTEIFELGFGTGLNTLLTCEASLKEKRKVRYTTTEPFPLAAEITGSLNYNDADGYLRKMHDADWDTELVIHDYFSFKKNQTTFQQATGTYDLVYFDAFAPLAQPELWTVDSFRIICSILNPGGIVTTYCSKSEIRKNMVAAGLRVEKIPGPWGKREMVRAHKPG